MFDINKVEKEAQEQIAKEREQKARDALIKQMRSVEAAKAVLRAEELKLQDIKAQIAEGSL